MITYPHVGAGIELYVVFPRGALDKSGEVCRICYTLMKENYLAIVDLGLSEVVNAFIRRYFQSHHAISEGFN